MGFLHNGVNWPFLVHISMSLLKRKGEVGNIHVEPFINLPVPTIADLVALRFHSTRVIIPHCQLGYLSSTKACTVAAIECLVVCIVDTGTMPTLGWWASDFDLTSKNMF